jgi:hypothetical protein
LNSHCPQVDCIQMSPGLGISSRAREAMVTLGVPGMHFLEFRVNGEPYYQFYTERIVDCLDRQRSEIMFFPDEPDRVMRVTKYAFVMGRLQDSDVFTLPELIDGMFFWSQPTFITERAKSTIDLAGLVGFRFAKCADAGFLSLRTES